MKLDVPVTPFVKDGIEHNVLRLVLDYDSRNKGPLLRLQMGQFAVGDGSMFASFKCSIFGSPSARVQVESGWKMRNAKRMLAAWDQVLAELAGKRGAVWAAVDALLKASGTGLAVPESVPA